MPDNKNAAIDIRDLRVDYGEFLAVNDVTLQVPQGEVFGLVGPNGAGKTSTFRVLATLMEPTYGEVKLAGVDIQEHQEQARRLIGYMPDLAPVPSDLKVWEFLDMFAESHGIQSAKARRARVDECLEQVQMLDARGKFCKELSRGQTQRVVLAKTLLHNPKVLILDEPASGMDPLSRRQLRLVLRQLASEGATVIVSSHILGELAEMCTSLCVMNGGRLLASGTVDEVRRELGRQERVLGVVVRERVDEAAVWLGARSFIKEVTISERRLAFHFEGDEADQASLLKELLSEGFEVLAYEEQKSSFEDILVKIAEGGR